MTARIIAIFLIVIPLQGIAQGNMRPVLDSTVTCSYYKGIHEFSENANSSKQLLEVFYIVEKMPVLLTPGSDIEDLLNDTILLNEQEKSICGDISFQCVVNCKGVAGDFQILDCPSQMLNIGFQVLNVFRDEYYKWEPGMQAGYGVDVFIRIKVTLRKGVFSLHIPVL